MITILECRIGNKPEIKQIDGSLESVQNIVEGYIESAKQITNQVCVFCNDDRYGLKYNCCGLFGNFIITKCDRNGNPISLDKEDIRLAMQWIAQEKQYRGELING